MVRNRSPRLDGWTLNDDSVIISGPQHEPQLAAQTKDALVRLRLNGSKQE